MNDQFGARFTVVEQIGGGNYGTLFRVIDKEAVSLADRIIATKKLKDPINHPHVLREVSVQRQAQQCTPHVAKLLHVVPRDQLRAALVLEYVPLDLRGFLNTFYCDRVDSAAPSWCATENGNGVIRGFPPLHLPLPYIRRLLRGLVEALSCLHARGVVHRDVKPENLLVEPLGLRHPLRCVCPSLKAAAAGQDEGRCGQCWVHANHDPSNNNGSSDAAAARGKAAVTVQESNGNAAAAASTSNASDRDGDGGWGFGGSKAEASLEPCRTFFHGVVVLHHELTGEDLGQAIHRLHCVRCRRATQRESAAAAAAADGESMSVRRRTEATVEDEQQQQEQQQLTATSAADKEDTAQSTTREKQQEEEEERGEGGQQTHADDTATPPLTPDIKLCDFGSARHISTLRLRSAEQQREELTPGPTTPVYCAPEMMLLQSYGTAVDMWAVGAILFEMLTGEFFLSVGTLRSFYGDLVVHDDYCVMHRLNMMFRHLGTPSSREWRSIAHPGFYPAAMLPHLPQVRRAALFASLADDDRGESVEKENSTSAHSIQEDQGNEEESRTAKASNGGSSLPPQEQHSAEEGWQGTEAPDLSRFLHHHIGACGLDFLRSLLRYDPAERLTAAAALQHPFLNMDDGASKQYDVDGSGRPPRDS